MKSLINDLLLVLALSIGNINITMSQDINLANICKMDINFVSGGCLIKGWIFIPSDSAHKKLPAIVMAPGFSGTKECNYQFFASTFSKAGFAVLLFDYPNFGESVGALKGEIDPWQQVQAYRDGISYLETRDDIDLNRIGVWGGSYSGGHAMVVSALDNRVKCMVAMTPFISGSFYVKNLPDEVKAFLFHQFYTDRLARVKGEKPMMIPVATNDKTQFSAISSGNAWDFIESVKAYAPTYENSVTLKSLEMQLEYEPGSYVQNINAIPKLFIIAKEDELIPEAQIIETFNKAVEPKKLISIDGHHFSPYMENLAEASRLAIEWFKWNL